MKSELDCSNRARLIASVSSTELVWFNFLRGVRLHSFAFTWSFETIWTLRNILQQQLAAIRRSDFKINKYQRGQHEEGKQKNINLKSECLKISKKKNEKNSDFQIDWLSEKN